MNKLRKKIFALIFVMLSIFSATILVVYNVQLYNQEYRSIERSLTQAVNFMIVAFIIFLLIRTVNRATAMFEKDKAVAAAEPKAEPADVALLREIRDELRARRP